MTRTINDVLIESSDMTPTILATANDWFWCVVNDQWWWQRWNGCPDALRGSITGWARADQLIEVFQEQGRRRDTIDDWFEKWPIACAPHLWECSYGFAIKGDFMPQPRYAALPGIRMATKADHDHAVQGLAERIGHDRRSAWPPKPRPIRTQRI